ncbi:MAG: START domain-containing protein, partial [Myxococcota bacterium]
MTGFIALTFTVLMVPDWELVEQDDELQVWTRERAGSDYEEIRARILLNASAEKTWTVLDDVERYQEFMPRLVEARVLERVGDRVLYQYQKIDPPVLAVRDCVMRIEISRTPGRYVRKFRASHHPLSPPLDDETVRLSVFEGEWRVEALGPNRSALVYQVHADPGGRVPSWLSNYASTMTLPRLMN